MIETDKYKLNIFKTGHHRDASNKYFHYELILS